MPQLPTIYKTDKVQCGYQKIITIHLNQQLRLDSAACLMFVRGASAATDGVYFVNENSCRCIKSGLQTKDNNFNKQQKHSWDFILYIYRKIAFLNSSPKSDKSKKVGRGEQAKIGRHFGNLYSFWLWEFDLQWKKPNKPLSGAEKSTCIWRGGGAHKPATGQHGTRISPQFHVTSKPGWWDGRAYMSTT